MTEDWSRFIDDVKVLFRGDKNMADWYFKKLNNMYPEVQFKWEFSTESAIFLDVEIIFDRESKRLETKIYVKPSNKQLFLNYRSNYPQHVFKGLLYSEALRAVMICSQKKWATEYLNDLREKFLLQEYPEKLIDEQFQKALQINRKDLLFGQNPNKKKKRVICPLVITFNTSNPPLAGWINEELKVLHQSPKMKQLVPYVSTVTRQSKNISHIVVRSRHWGRGNVNQMTPQRYNPPPPGNFKLHNSKCMVCKRMEDGRKKFSSSKTGRQYTISRHYTCQSKYIVYLITCLLCDNKPQYVGQSIQKMSKRHYGHRNEMKKGNGGMGEHFQKHMKEKNWDVDQMSDYVDVTVIGSVDSSRLDARKRLDNLETDFQNRLMTMNFHGGMNDRDDRRRESRM